MPCFVYKLCIQLKGGKFKVKVWADICLRPRQQSLVNKISREMRKGKKKQGNWGRQKMVKRGLGRRPTVRSYCKNSPKTRFYTDCTCACNGLTNFECEAQATGNGSYLKKRPRKNSWSQLGQTYVLAGFPHVEPLCGSASSRHSVSQTKARSWEARERGAFARAEHCPSVPAILMALDFCTTAILLTALLCSHGPREVRILTTTKASDLRTTCCVGD